ncbi:MAG: hypothetical protein FJZ56_02485, partial [Chlamydiae bacterium]|nr:hypothetical protein [Chlamydiota bacterium]
MGRFLFLCLGLTTLLSAQDKAPSLIKKPRSPNNDYAQVMLIQSQQTIKKDEPILVRTRGFPVGQLSPPYASFSGLQRKDQFCDVLGIIDGKRSFLFSYTDGASFTESRNYFHYTLEKKLSSINGGVSKGPHSLVVVLRNSYGETLKNAASMDTMVFSYQSESTKKELQQLGQLLEKPMVIYNEPAGVYAAGAPILFDFYKLGCTIGPADYKVAVYLDNTLLQKVSVWGPFILKNVSKGKHTIRLELISPLDEVVANPFGATIEGSFEV